jgi:hypothetical protein
MACSPVCSWLRWARQLIDASVGTTEIFQLSATAIIRYSGPVGLAGPDESGPEDLGQKKIRFPQKDTCLVIYSLAVNSGDPLGLILST